MTARIIITGVALSVLIAGGGAAQACGGGHELFTDSFETLADAWGSADEFMKVDNGALTITESDGDFYSVLAGPIFDEVDYCAKFVLTDSSDPAGSYSGVAFWAKDTNSFYTFQITLDGYATAYQYTGKWKQLLKDRKIDSVDEGVGAENDLRVVTSGKKATFYVNGTKFDTITGIPPKGGQHIGFTIEAPENGNAAFALDDVQVNEPETN